jgi:hypothetical protein
LTKDVDIVPTALGESLAGNPEQGLAQVDKIYGIEGRDGEEFIHELDVVTYRWVNAVSTYVSMQECTSRPTSSPANIDPDETAVAIRGRFAKVLQMSS